MQFAGGEAVGGGRVGGEQLARELPGLLGPRCAMRAAAASWLPGAFVALGAGSQVAGSQAMELALANAKLCAGIGGVQLPAAMQAKEVADEIRGVTMAELAIFFCDMGCAA